MQCPGQDSRYWDGEAVFEANCSECGNVLEFFKDDNARKCGKCGHEATQRVDHLVNYNLGCAGCKGRKRAEVTKATIAKRTIKKGFVPFSKKQTPKQVAAIVKKHRPDVQMMELPFYRLRPNKNSGDWYVKTKCGKCGFVAIQSVPHLVNYNRGCAGCRDKN